ncbi:Steroid nuclear receptor, ligand-binding domain containing protein [Dorcoceras hygrometricum]|uniref:Steroid nuclear receptor, ligand-binding domain containing protein n=1 Tax=Dorcoceras hygrometricum TaxID=472368 RepID=A0A2Z7CV04_9LAMI|nr:Steroid nuclear receptor, ligand-binding domain containing protein [Dorcoceras hygrometricum]
MENGGMVKMFKALESSGLKGFLGCSSAIYEAVDVDEPAGDEPVVKKNAASKRRPAPAVGEPVSKKKRTTAGRAAPTEKGLAIVPVVQDVEPLSTIPVPTPKAPKRRAPKRQLKLPTGSDGEKEVDVGDTVEKSGRQLLSILAVCGSVKDIVAKEEHMLAWAETDSLETVVQRRMYIIAKYREMFLRKFLEAHRENFQSGQLTTAIDLQIIDLLSDAHLFALETLQTQMRVHGLKWERICSSSLFEGENRDRGAVIARSNTNNWSSCWIRTMILVDGSWIIQEGGDFWKPLPRTVLANGNFYLNDNTMIL